MRGLLARCSSMGGSPLVVLGTMGPSRRAGVFPKGQEARDLWLHLSFTSRGNETKQTAPLPSVIEVEHDGTRSNGEQLASQVVLYSPPDSSRGHFLTPGPLPMNEDLQQPEQASKPASAAEGAAVGVGDEDGSTTEQPSSIPSTDLERNVEQISCAWLVEALLARALSADKAKTDLDIDLAPVCGKRVWGVLAALVALVALLDRWLIAPLLWFLAQPVPFGLTVLLRVRQVAAVGRQLDLRLRALRQCVAQWRYLVARRGSPWRHSPERRVVELSLANAFWLMAIDVLAGALFMAVAWSSADWLAQKIAASDYDAFWYEPLRGGPAGIKLNPQLSEALGAVFLYLMDSWTVVNAEMLPYLPLLLRVASLAGLLGLTMTLALLSDLISFCTIHIFYFYTVSARFYAIMLHVLSSLWKLFRGKKRNVLRERIDSYSYDVDQLLLGTLLFTVIFFLMPTTFVFYLYFGLLRLLVMSLHAALAFITEGLNHFPLYSLFLARTDPESLPSGLSFSPLPPTTNVPAGASSSSYLCLHGRTMAPGGLFHRYRDALRDVLRRYAPQTLLARFLVGDIMLAT